MKAFNRKDHTEMYEDHMRELESDDLKRDIRRILERTAFYSGNRVEPCEKWESHARGIRASKKQYEEWKSIAWSGDCDVLWCSIRHLTRGNSEVEAMCRDPKIITVPWKKGIVDHPFIMKVENSMGKLGIEISSEGISKDEEKDVVKGVGE